MDLVLVPFLNCLTKLFLAFNEVSSVIRSYFFWPSSSSDEASSGVDKRFCIHRVNNFDVDCSYGEARKQSTVPLSGCSSTAYCEWTKQIYAYIRKGWLGRRDTILWQTGHFLLHYGGLAAPKAETHVENVADVDRAPRIQYLCLMSDRVYAIPEWAEALW